jgi:hypothetical protein
VELLRLQEQTNQRLRDQLLRQQSTEEPVVEEPFHSLDIVVLVNI